MALSAIADDPRVRRQGEAFHRAGWQVVGIGLRGARSAPPEWRILTGAGNATVEMASPRLPLIHRFAARVQGWAARALYLAGLAAVRVCPSLAQLLYWHAIPQITEIEACAREAEADIWLANDWNTLPLAARLARRKGGIYGYDTHEFATEEYAERPRWRRWVRPFVRAIEARHITVAAVTSAVSVGIAERLDRLYSLPRRTLVVRNMPAYEAATLRPTGAPIRVLYHGILAPGRGLEAAIDSVALWRPELELTLRGPGAEPYLDELRARIERVGLTDRVQLAPPVPMTALVREAAAFDIGLFALPGSSRHNQFALPNKFFEYAMAGLALCVTDLPEMGALVRQYGLGVTFAAADARSIGAAVNGLDRARIDACKRNALAAARELCWERESARLVETYQAALMRPDSLAA